MTVTLSAEARARLDRHLDAVEQALAAAGNSRERRRAVVDDLEAQIQEMLAAISATPTLEDVEAVLGKLDPPASYREAAGAPGSVPPVASPGPAAPTAVKPVRPRYSRTAIWGLVCILVSFLPPMALLPLGGFWVSKPMAGPRSVAIRPADAPGRVAIAPAGPAIAAQTMPAEDAATTAGAAPTTVPAREATGDQVEVSPAGVRVRSGKDTVAVTPGGVRVESGGERVTVGPGALTASSEPGSVRVSSGTSWGGLLQMLPCFACVVGPLGLVGTVLGWVAFAQIRGSGGAITGTGLALFDGLFYPVAGVLLLIVALLTVA